MVKTIVVFVSHRHSSAPLVLGAVNTELHPCMSPALAHSSRTGTIGGTPYLVPVEYQSNKYLVLVLGLLHGHGCDRSVPGTYAFHTWVCVSKVDACCVDSMVTIAPPSSELGDPVSHGLGHSCTWNQRLHLTKSFDRIQPLPQGD